jgi:hypothetical protein
VTGGYEGQGRVGVAAGAIVVSAVEDEHVRAHGGGTGLCLAHGPHGAGKINRLGDRGGGVMGQLTAVEEWSVPELALNLSSWSISQTS